MINLDLVPQQCSDGHVGERGDHGVEEISLALSLGQMIHVNTTIERASLSPLQDLCAANSGHNQPQG